MAAAAKVRRFTAAFAVAMIAVLALAACSTATRGDAALPEGFTERGMVDTDASVFMLLAPEAPFAVPAGLFGQDGPDTLSVISVEAIANTPPKEFAARFEFASESAAKAAHELAVTHSQPAWADVEGRFLAISASDGPWASALRDAWAAGARAKIEERYPDEWEALRLLPETPPAPPIAAGFARNLGDLLDTVLEAGEIEVPGLANALSLIRVEQIAYAAYAPELTVIPDSVTPATLRGSGVGVIAVAESSYPGLVINFLASRFKGRAGLEDATVSDRTVLYRSLEDEAHLMAINYGPTFFFAVAPTRAGVEELIASVIESQSSRRG